MTHPRVCVCEQVDAGARPGSETDGEVHIASSQSRAKCLSGQAALLRWTYKTDDP
jgi:hypothetical protein